MLSFRPSSHHLQTPSGLPWRRPGGPSGPVQTAVTHADTRLHSGVREQLHLCSSVCCCQATSAGVLPWSLCCPPRERGGVRPCRGVSGKSAGPEDPEAEEERQDDRYRAAVLRAGCVVVVASSLKSELKLSVLTSCAVERCQVAPAAALPGAHSTWRRLHRCSGGQ